VNHSTILFDMGLGPIWIAKYPTVNNELPASATENAHITAEQSLPLLNTEQIAKMDWDALSAALHTLAPQSKLGEGNPQGNLFILLDQHYSDLDSHAIQLLHNVLKAAQCPIESVYFTQLNKIPDKTALNQAILAQQIQLLSPKPILCFSADLPKMENTQAWICSPSLTTLYGAIEKAALWQQLCLLELGA
jgi:DNA polymerase III psi subunit